MVPNRGENAQVSLPYTHDRTAVPSPSAPCQWWHGHTWATLFSSPNVKPLRPAALPTLYLLTTLLCQKKGNTFNPCSWSLSPSRRTLCKSPSLYTEISSATFKCQYLILSWIYIDIHRSYSFLTTFHMQAPQIHICMWPTNPTPLFCESHPPTPVLQHCISGPCKLKTEPESTYTCAWDLLLHAETLMHKI